MLSRCLVTKFLHQSPAGSLLRVRCWLGSANQCQAVTPWQHCFFFAPLLCFLAHRVDTYCTVYLKQTRREFAATSSGTSTPKKKRTYFYTFRFFFTRKEKTFMAAAAARSFRPHLLVFLPSLSQKKTSFFSYSKINIVEMRFYCYYYYQKKCM